MQTLKCSQGKGDGEILVPSEHGCEVPLTVESAEGRLQRRALTCTSGLQPGEPGQWGNTFCCPAQREGVLVSSHTRALPRGKPGSLTSPKTRQKDQSLGILPAFSASLILRVLSEKTTLKDVSCEELASFVVWGSCRVWGCRGWKFFCSRSPEDRVGYLGPGSRKFGISPCCREADHHCSICWLLWGGVGPAAVTFDPGCCSYSPGMLLWAKSGLDTSFVFLFFCLRFPWVC